MYICYSQQQDVSTRTVRPTCRSNKYGLLLISATPVMQFLQLPKNALRRENKSNMQQNTLKQPKSQYNVSEMHKLKK